MGVWELLFGESWSGLQAFSFLLDEIPKHATSVLVDTTAVGDVQNLQIDAIAPVLRYSWPGMVLAIVHGIWVWRMALVLDSAQSSATKKVMERVDQRVRALAFTYRYSEDHKVGAAERTVMAKLIRLWTPVTGRPTAGPFEGKRQYVCFFDGSSRGNPDPGGAGSVVVAVETETRAAQVIWFAAMAYCSRSTTNNIAEY